jgi:hypothetical protein
MSDVITEYRFGRQAATHPIGYRDIFHYASAIPDAPSTFDHTNGFNQFRMLGNGPDPSLTVNGGNPVGDCAWVGTVNAGIIDAVATDEDVVFPSSNEVVSNYLQYDHGRDLGANLSQLLAYWHRVGLPWSPKLPGYAALNFHDLDEFWAAINAFTLGYIGIIVTETMMSQTQSGEPWDLTGLPSDDNILGGHCVDVLARDADGGEVVTWRLRQKFTTRWFKKNVEESHLLLTEQQVIKGSNGYGLDLEHLQHDLAGLSV